MATDGWSGSCWTMRSLDAGGLLSFPHVLLSLVRQMRWGLCLYFLGIQAALFASGRYESYVGCWRSTLGCLIWWSCSRLRSSSFQAAGDMLTARGAEGFLGAGGAGGLWHIGSKNSA